jgi:hypothetical protein
VIVFGGHENIAVELCDFLLPALDHLILRRRPSIRRRLIEKRHRKIAQVDNFRLYIVAPSGNVPHPLRRLRAEARGARGADDADLEFAHGSLYLWLRIVTEAR